VDTIFCELDGTLIDRKIGIPRSLQDALRKGLWIEQTEGAKFWLKVMNELKTAASASDSQSLSMYTVVPFTKG
jgi:hypothetical protein